MKKILLFLTLLFSNYLFCQVTIDGITVNNVGISGTTISLGTLSTVNVNLNASVVLSSSPSDSYPGTITIYYKKAPTFQPIVANGGESSPLLFLGGIFGTKSFRLTLNSAQFDTSGGVLYAEYKTYSGIVTKSSNISITKNIPIEPGGGTGGGGCDICSAEFIPYGGIPILPFSAPHPNSLTDYEWFVSKPTGEYVRYSTDRGNEIYQSCKLVLKKETDPPHLSAAVHTIYTDKPYNQMDNYIQRLNISNSIGQNQTIAYGGTPETIIGTAGNVNGQPNNTYQWQERIASEHDMYVSHPYNIWKDTYGWKNIPNANQINYTPPGNATQVKAYRRLLIDNHNIPMASNEVTIYVVSTDSVIDNTNQICCDKIYFPNDIISPIVGQEVDIYYFIQWQQGKVGEGNIVMEWRNLENERGKDKVPYPTINRSNPRPYSSTTYYRRTLTNRLNGKLYVSNPISIKYTNISNRKISSQDNKNMSYIDDIVIYPNPSSSTINIESGHDLSSFNAKIVDVTGRLILNNNYELNGYSTQLNISDLPTGIYTIVIENGQEKIIKKLIKK